jgi:DNA-binding protein YbaB
MTHSKATVRPDKATIKSLPIDVLIMIIEILRFEDALELCHALHIPEQVAAQYCYLDENDIYHMIHDFDLKPNSFKFMLKNKRFQTEADSDDKTEAALITFDLEFVKNFIEEFKPDLNVALSVAADIGFPDAVKFLLSDSRVDPSAWDNIALRNAAEAGRVESLKLLLSDSRVDPSAEDNEALKDAAMNGHTEIVKLLLSDSRVDPSAEDNEALINAATDGHVEIVKLLLSNSRLEVSAEMIQDLLSFAAGKEVKKLLKSYLKKKQSKE